MTGGGGGHHRGRVPGGPGGAHWWGGTGPTGGGTHAIRRARLRGPVLLLALLAVLVVGVATAVALTPGPEPAPASAGPAVAPAPAAPGPPVSASARPVADVEVLQRTIDDVLVAAPLRFPADSAVPDPAASAGIDRLAAALRATPGARVTVEGHTAPAGENTGSAQPLSRQRADEVRRRLEAAGVPADRLAAVGVGPDRPLPTLEASRRVEIRVG